MLPRSRFCLFPSSKRPAYAEIYDIFANNLPDANNPDFVSEHSCKDFRCTTKEFCIHPDLLCDNVNHCEDGSDEAIGTVCEGKEHTLRGIYDDDRDLHVFAQRPPTTTSSA